MPLEIIATAACLVQKPNSVAHGVHHRDEGLADLRLLKLRRTTVEESDLLRRVLGLLRLLPELGLKAMSLVFRESTVAGRYPSRVHHSLHWLGSHHKVDNRSERTRHPAHEVRAGQKTVEETWGGGAETAAGRMDKVSDLNTGRTGDLTAFAVHAILQVLIEEILVLQTKPLPVRTCLLRSRIQRIDSHNRTVGGTNRTLDALFEIIETYVLSPA